MRKKTFVGKVKPIEKRWLSAAEAKSYLDCSDNWLQKLRDEDLVRVSMVGRKIYYDLSSIEKLLENNVL